MSFFHRLEEYPWPQLRELRLKKVMAPVNQLKALLCNCQQTLCTFELTLLWIRGGDEEPKSLFSAFSSSRFSAMDGIKIQPLWLVKINGSAFTFLRFLRTVDEVEGARLIFASRYWKGSRINCFVDYLSPRMNIALGILANTVDLTWIHVFRCRVLGWHCHEIPESRMPGERHHISSFKSR